MASGDYEKGFSKEVVSKLKTKRQVRICPAQAGGDPSRIESTCKGLQATWSSTGSGKRDVGYQTWLCKQVGLPGYPAFGLKGCFYGLLRARVLFLP